MKVKNKKSLHIATICIIIIAFICIIMIGISTYIHHWSNQEESSLHNHLTRISNNKKFIGNKKVNGKYTIIYFQHNCPHCMHIVPKVYVHNKLDLFNAFRKHPIQYRDVAGRSHSRNYNTALDMKVTNVPQRVTVIMHNGYIRHVTKNKDVY